jgi:hypothetical protein
MKIKHETEISSQRIADMMVTAIEGNHMTRAWCSGIHLKGDWEARQSELAGPWYSDPKLYDGAFEIEVLELDDERTGKTKAHKICEVDLANGLRLMAEKWSKHFADLVQENDDASTADVFLQMIVLGQLVYG